MTGSQSIAYHDGLAASWSDRYLSGGFKRRAAFFVEEVLPRVTYGGKWLDAGCGSGVFSRILADRGADVTAIDGSAAMIAAARSAPIEPSWDHPPRYVVASLDRYDAASKRFDGVICLSVLEYLPDVEEMFATLAGQLAPGGTLIVSVPNRLAALRRIQLGLRKLAAPIGLHIFAYLDTSLWSASRSELDTLARQNGLNDVRVIGFDPLLPRPLWRFLPPSLLFMVCRLPHEDH